MLVFTSAAIRTSKRKEKGFERKMSDRKRPRLPEARVGPPKKPRILWRCQWLIDADGRLMWETIDMTEKVRRQPFAEISRHWPLNDEEIEEMKRKILLKMEPTDGTGDIGR